MSDEIARLRRMEAALEDDEQLEKVVALLSPSSRIDGQRRHALQDYRAALREAAGKEGER